MSNIFAQLAGRQFKGKFDCSPLNLKEKLFYGIRKNPTARNERNYPITVKRVPQPKEILKKQF